MIRMEPAVYSRFFSGLPGGHPSNSLREAALYVHRGERNTLYRIHGTQQADRIGQSFSSGCIRLANANMMDLYARVAVGTVMCAV